MPASEEAYGPNHPATQSREAPLETELREVAPGQFGYVAVNETVEQQGYQGQLSGEIYGDSDKHHATFPQPPKSHDTGPDS